MKTTVKYKKLSAKQAKDMMDNDNELVVLDVRTQEEYDEIHIKGAIRITNSDLLKLAPSKLPNKDVKILVHCRSGARSSGSAQTLIDMGYANIYDFGGLMDWPYDTVSGK